MAGDREGATVRSTAAAAGAGTNDVRAHAAGTRGAGTDRDVLGVLGRVLETARSADYEGYSKHDGLNSPVLAWLAGGSRLRRLGAIQVVTRSPVDIRPMLGVRKARNAKGLSLFSRALLARHRLTGSADDAREARELLDRVVTSFVGQALLDGYETLTEERYLGAATRAVRFLLEAPKTLFEDDGRRCVSYVPDRSIDWIVMDVSALAGTLAARLGAITGDRDLIREGGRLVRYVVSKQTPDGAWFYADPPSASHITHDNYHTGFILDAILQYGLAAGTDEFDDAYRRGIEFYERRLFEPSGAARFMSDRKYPVDIHGCAQGILTFSLRQRHRGTGAETATRVLDWTLRHMWDPASGWFYYQKRRAYRTRIRELRWCQGWMSWALASYLENCGGEA